MKNTLLRSLFFILVLVVKCGFGQDYPQLDFVDTMEDIELATFTLDSLSNLKKKDEIFQLRVKIRKIQLLFNENKYEESIKASNELLITLKEPEQNWEIARLYKNKGWAYYNLQDRKQAYEYLNLALDKSRQTTDLFLTSNILSNLGAMNLEDSNYMQADKLLKESIDLIHKTNNHYHYRALLTKRVYATNFHYQKKFKIADSLYNAVLADYHKAKLINAGYLGAVLFSAKMHSDMGNGSQAVDLILKAIEMARFYANNNDFVAIYMSASDIYKENKNYQIALEYADSAYTLLSSNFEANRAMALAKSEAKYRNQLLRNDILISNQRKQKWMAFTAFLISALILGGVSVFLFIKRKETKEKLQRSKQILNALIEGEEKERLRISRELHDGISQDMLALQHDLKRRNADPDAINYLSKISEEVRNISYQLMPASLRLLGLVPSMEETCTRLLKSTGIEFNIDVKDIKERLGSEIELAIHRVFQEIMQNLVKHSKASKVDIQIIRKQTFLLLIIEDNGIGFRLPESSKGLGLSNIKGRLDLINGNIEYDSDGSDGTTVIIRVPL